MRDIRVAKPYARALYGAALEQNALVEIVRDIDKLRELIDQSQEFARLITSPILSPEFKSETFQQIFVRALHPLTVNFLKLLASKQRERYLTAIIDVFSSIVDEAAGRRVAKVTTAVPLTSAQEAQLIQHLGAYSGKQIRLEATTDPKIQGGFVVQLDDTVFDASLATQLQRLKHQLAEG